jgi:hypothetical protein
MFWSRSNPSVKHLKSGYQKLFGPSWFNDPKVFAAYKAGVPASEVKKPQAAKKKAPARKPRVKAVSRPGPGVDFDAEIASYERVERRKAPPARRPRAEKKPRVTEVTRAPRPDRYNSADAMEVERILNTLRSFNEAYGNVLMSVVPHYPKRSMRVETDLDLLPSGRHGAWPDLLQDYLRDHLRTHSPIIVDDEGAGELGIYWESWDMAGFVEEGTPRFDTQIAIPRTTRKRRKTRAEETDQARKYPGAKLGAARRLGPGGASERGADRPAHFNPWGW